ncbi:MAG TPA: hypothetical protein VJV76_08265 [Gaiellaceae bacterium]|nr:hypothetical protein [Gaiellaceae bacterium]
MNREPTLDDLIDAETTGEERARLRGVHEMLLEAGPPPELSPKLEAGPTLGMTLQRKRALKRRAMLLLAATLAVVGVFLAGYAVANRGGGGNSPALTEALKGTGLAPQAQGTLEVWDSRAGNWPMTLSVVGLKQLAPHSYYEVYLVRNGKPWGSCGAFRVTSAGAGVVTVTLTAPYTLRKGDSWVVTLRAAGGTEPGKTVLRAAPIRA